MYKVKVYLEGKDFKHALKITMTQITMCVELQMKLVTIDDVIENKPLAHISYTNIWSKFEYRFLLHYQIHLLNIKYLHFSCIRKGTQHTAMNRGDNGRHTCLLPKNLTQAYIFLYSKPKNSKAGAKLIPYLVDLEYSRMNCRIKSTS